MLYHNYPSAMLECNGNTKWKQFLLSAGAGSELLAAPSLPICRKHQPSPPWALTDLPCVSGEQKGTTEAWEQRDKGTQHLRGEGKGQRLLTVRTSTLWKQPVPGKFSDSGFCGQMGIHPWKGWGSNTPSPLLSLSTDTGGCRASPEKLALHYTHLLLCAARERINSSATAGLGGESPGPAAGLCGVLHTLPETPRIPEPIPESLGWKRSHTLSTQCVSLAASERSWAQRWCLCRWLIHLPCCWWPGTLCQGIHQDPEQSTLPQTQGIQTGLFLPHFLQTFCSLCALLLTLTNAERRESNNSCVSVKSYWRFPSM